MHLDTRFRREEEEQELCDRLDVTAGRWGIHLMRREAMLVVF